MPVPTIELLPKTIVLEAVTEAPFPIATVFVKAPVEGPALYPIAVLLEPVVLLIKAFWSRERCCNHQLCYYIKLCILMRCCITWIIRNCSIIIK